MSRKNKGETTYKETAFGIIPRSKLIPLEIEGIKKAWDFVLKQSRRGSILITPASLLKIHKVGFGWIFPRMAGKFRSIEVKVSDHSPPKFFLIPQLIFDFTEDLKVRIQHLPSLSSKNYIYQLTELLSWAHHRFLWIHPFTDYNGRVGRLLINMILLNLKLPPIELHIETRHGRHVYIQALKAGDKDNFNTLKKIMRAALNEAGRNIY